MKNKSKKETNKYVIIADENQIKIIKDALDFQARVMKGQFSEIGYVYKLYDFCNLPEHIINVFNFLVDSLCSLHSNIISRECNIKLLNKLYSQSDRIYQIKKHIEYNVSCINEPDKSKRGWDCSFDKPMIISDIGVVEVYKADKSLIDSIKSVVEIPE